MSYIQSLKRLLSSSSKRHAAFSDVTMDLIDSIYSENSHTHQNVVHEILNIDEKHVYFIPEEERGLPGNPLFIQTGYYKTMLKRYFFAGAYFCKDKDILDSCSGLGWGTYILSQYAKSVTAFDRDAQAISFSSETWGSGNIRWIQGDALDFSFLDDYRFDIITGMETIEHFDKQEGIRYMENVRSALQDKGIFIGTSSFPSDRSAADELCAKNPFHKYIYTLSEMNDLLGSCFSEHAIVDGWMFIARR